MMPICVVLWLSLTLSAAYHQDSHADCALWVSQGECVNNARYLWVHCQTSCATATDVDTSCEKWAQEGECSANPGYVAVRCPEACGMALSWNPYLRRKMNLEDLPEEAVDFGCSSLSSVVHVAALMHERLKIIFYGGYAVPNIGFSFRAPSEYLGMLGLADAMLYTMRLYCLVIDGTGDSQLKNAQRDRLDAALNLLGSGYDDDVLMRGLMPVMQSLFDAQEVVKQVYSSSGDIFASLEGLCSHALEPHLESLVYSGIAPIEKIATPSSPVAAHVSLTNGVTMPTVGLGTWQIEGQACREAVLAAIRGGYRHIDSAEAYGNEADIGHAITQAINAGMVTRQELFIATKLSDEANAGYDKVMLKVESQMRDLQVDYLDLYMLHSPISNRDLQASTWKALEVLYRSGKIKALGVSNFSGRELRSLVETSEVLPMVVQNKFDVYHLGKQLDNQGDDVVAYARSKGIVIVGYSSLSSFPFSMLPAHDPIINYVASKQASPTTSSQVILRWILQLGGTAVIPRSTNPDRLKENLDVLNMAPLPDEHMHLINMLQYLIASPVNKAV